MRMEESSASFRGEASGCAFALFPLVDANFMHFPASEVLDWIHHPLIFHYGTAHNS